MCGGSPRQNINRKLDLQRAISLRFYFLLHICLFFYLWTKSIFLKMNTKMWMLQVLCVCVCAHAVQARIWAWMLSIPYSASENGPVGPRDREAEIFPNNPKGDMVSFHECFKHLTLNTKLVCKLYLKALTICFIKVKQKRKKKKNSMSV